MSSEGHADTADRVDDLKSSLEAMTNISVARIEGPELVEVMGSISAYREWIVSNIEQSPAVDSLMFAKWMESADRDSVGFPAPWVGDLMGRLDSVLIQAARHEGYSPENISRALNEWVEESKSEAEAMYDLEEGFFDVE